MSMNGISLERGGLERGFGVFGGGINLNKNKIIVWREGV